MNKNLHFNLKASYESPLVEVMEVSLVDAILNSSYGSQGKAGAHGPWYDNSEEEDY